MTLLERINLLLLKVQQLRISQESERRTCRHVTTEATLEEGVKRVPKSYQPRVEQDEEAYGE
jgi:hypothetical protein